MKHPFFRTPQLQSNQPAKMLVVPTRVAPPAERQAQRPESGVAAATAVATPRPAAPVSHVPAIPLCLGSILPQLPAAIFCVSDKAHLTAVTIAVPASLVLPQLGLGKIEVPLTDLFSLLPKDVVQDQFPSTCASQKVVLPLAECIGAIPPDAFAPTHEAMIAIDTPEFNKLPSL